jgi:hypothetical protein
MNVQALVIKRCSVGFMRQPLRLIHALEEQTMKVYRPIGKNRLYIAIISFTMLLGGLLAAPALAVDGKEYSGAMCKEGFEGPGGHIREPTGDIWHDLEGNARHMGASGYRWVVCPLVRDAERRSGSITYVAVNVYKPDAQGVFCEIVSKPYFGGTGWTKGKWDYSPAGLRLLELPVQADTYLSGSFFLRCLLNPSVNGNISGIAHYGIVETD